MGYLVLTRKEGEHITIRNAEDLLAQLLLDGITIRVGQIVGGQVKIDIDAPIDLEILRGGLEKR